MLRLMYGLDFMILYRMLIFWKSGTVVLFYFKSISGFKRGCRIMSVALNTMIIMYVELEASCLKHLL